MQKELDAFSLGHVNMPKNFPMWFLDDIFNDHFVSEMGFFSCFRSLERKENQINRQKKIFNFNSPRQWQRETFCFGI